MSYTKAKHVDVGLYHKNNEKSSVASPHAWCLWLLWKRQAGPRHPPMAHSGHAGT